MREAIAHFMAQDYPAERRHLLICDDGNQLPASKSDNISVISLPTRFRTISAKFNFMARAAFNRGAEIICVWEDDDVYLPWHISAAEHALRSGPGAKPSHVWSDYTGSVQIEKADGRFHASLSMSRKAFDRIGGWPNTQRADFDQQLIAALAACGIVNTVTAQYPPSYVFRWSSTGTPHGQGFMRSPDDVTWWDRCARTLPPLTDWSPQPILSDTVVIIKKHAESACKTWSL